MSKGVKRLINLVSSVNSKQLEDRCGVSFTLELKKLVEFFEESYNLGANNIDTLKESIVNKLEECNKVGGKLCVDDYDWGSYVGFKEGLEFVLKLIDE
jgi:hypothetical protein